jgi:N-acetylmuramoyl-L-alanine amidase
LIGKLCGIILVVELAVLGQTAIAQRTAPATGFERANYAIAKLYELHFWTGKTYSLTDDANRQAIIAFQKLSGLPRTGELTDSTIARIMEATNSTPRDSIHARHIEVDLDHQVLFVVDSSDRVARILPVSTGTGKRFLYPGKGKEYARTPRGKFKVYYKVTGWKKSPLGLMFDPMYILGGFAVHGARSVPPTPASHGCIRIPMFAAGEMFRTTPIGMPVVVFGENPKPAK